MYNFDILIGRLEADYYYFLNFSLIVDGWVFVQYETMIQC